MIIFIIFIVSTVLGLLDSRINIASKSFLLEKINTKVNDSIANSTELRNYNDFYYAINIDAGIPV